VDAVTPAATPVDIADDETPRAAPLTAAWALINLLLVFLSTIMMLGAIWAIRNRRKDEQITTKKANWLRGINIAVVIGAIIAFVLTEDVTLPMVLTDKWTIMMAVIALVEVVALIFSMRNTDEAEDEEAATV
jgi:cytochrome bd-type quinol oxidase subunit 2